MQIGKKIKSIRTSKLITQKQLAGDKITRNMLSRIENGAATPSLGTVYYLASRLNVSPGYLLAEGEDEELFRKIYRIGNIRRAYGQGNFRICRDLCLDSGLESDDEINLILSRCCAGLAKEDFRLGRLRSAVRSFEEAVDYAEKSVYNDEITRAEAGVYFRYMRRVSQTLGGDVSGREVNEGLSYGDPFCVYITSLETLESGAGAVYMKNLCPGARGLERTSPLAAHLEARRAMMAGNHEGAAGLLRSILTSVHRVPEPFLYGVFYDLEVCSKELNDYRGAYEFAAGKVNLLEKMLSEGEI